MGRIDILKIALLGLAMLTGITSAFLAGLRLAFQVISQDPTHFMMPSAFGALAMQGAVEMTFGEPTLG